MKQTSYTPSSASKNHPAPSITSSPHQRKRTADESGSLRLLLGIAITALLLVASILFLARDVLFQTPDSDAPLGDDIPDAPVETGDSIATPGSHPFADGAAGDVTFPFDDDVQVIFKSDLYSQRAVLIDLTSGQVIASRLADEKMYPASMTKIMTLIVAVENLPEEVSLDYPVTVSTATYDAMYRAGASGIGLEPGEQLTVESLMYLTILNSDGIAATELARYIAGSEAEFVSLMNRKASSMGLEHTHFANPTGLQDEANYSTCRDMAAILAYAMDMSLCRRILTTSSWDALCTITTGKDAGKSFHYYASHYLLNTLMTQKYPTIKPTSLAITAGKTGYAGASSGYCLASYAVSVDGHAYICVTSQAQSGSSINGYEACLRDHKWIYDTYAN